jgi:hypothetical protein
MAAHIRLYGNVGFGDLLDRADDVLGGRDEKDNTIYFYGCCTL